MKKLIMITAVAVMCGGQAFAAEFGDLAMSADALRNEYKTDIEFVPNPIVSAEDLALVGKHRDDLDFRPDEAIECESMSSRHVNETIRIESIVDGNEERKITLGSDLLFGIGDSRLYYGPCHDNKADKKLICGIGSVFKKVIEIDYSEIVMRIIHKKHFGLLVVPTIFAEMHGKSYLCFGDKSFEPKK